jgi:hypothetical protein
MYLDMHSPTLAMGLGLVACTTQRLEVGAVVGAASCPVADVVYVGSHGTAVPASGFLDQYLPTKLGPLGAVLLTSV